MRAEFDQLDFDKSGFITENEITGLYLALYESLADQGAPLK
jgi:hypothetical protein